MNFPFAPIPGPRRSGGGLPFVLALVAASLPAVGERPIDFQGSHQMMPFDEAIINYSKTPDNGPIARLNKELESGEVSLEWDDRFGYLPALLEALDISQSSQMLVGTKTSLQRYLISPQNPRALFFGEGAYIGFIPSAPLLEITGVDPRLGGVFYTLEQDRFKRPKLERNNQCLECHASFKSIGVPGHLIRSHEANEQGGVDLFSGVSPVNHRTPFAERWGGWYVTGQHGEARHMGNQFGEAARERQNADPTWRANLADLEGLIDVTKYPRPTSDIVALMVFEHQTHMHNFLTRIHYEAVISLRLYKHVRYLKQPLEGLLRYFLFVDEVPLQAPVTGSTEFAEEFQQLGPRDGRGRSLRDLDMKKRMFKYPFSYMIYSDAFDGLQEEVKEKFYHRLWEILSGQDKTPEYQFLTEADRRAIKEILIDTKDDLPGYWKM